MAMVDKLMALCNRLKACFPKAILPGQARLRKALEPAAQALRATQ